jgi:hypothetical protein
MQVEVPWALGPPDGRYLLRAPGDAPDAAPSHVLLFTTLGAPERRRFARRQREAEPEPEPTPVTTGRATVIDATEPFTAETEAGRWLSGTDDADLARELAVLNRALHAFRLVTADPHLQPIPRDRVLVARLGYGLGDEVSDGRWREARELLVARPRGGRTRVLEPQARLAAMLSGREPPLVCEELVLRARLDLEHSREREAALQTLVALDAAIAELAVEATAQKLAERISELRGQRSGVAGAAQAALAGSLSAAQLETVQFTLQRIESALRARAVANA